MSKEKKSIKKQNRIPLPEVEIFAQEITECRMVQKAETGDKVNQVSVLGGKTLKQDEGEDDGK